METLNLTDSLTAEDVAILEAAMLASKEAKANRKLSYFEKNDRTAKTASQRNDALMERLHYENRSNRWNPYR